MFVRVTSVVPTSRARENYSNQRACRVRFTPNSDRESGFPHKVMSALPPKADMCGATRDVCYGPIADICDAEAVIERLSKRMTCRNRPLGSCTNSKN